MLTEREEMIALLIWGGCTLEDILKDAHIKESTFKNYRRNIYKKLEIKSDEELKKKLRLFQVYSGKYHES